jgi:HpcH/HpaI aldolase/citrate lyase family
VSGSTGCFPTQSTAYWAPATSRRCCKLLAGRCPVWFGWPQRLKCRSKRHWILARRASSSHRSIRQRRRLRWSGSPGIPLGTRGVGIGRAHGYALRLQEYLTSANDQVAVIVQIEHIDAVTQIEAIVGVGGIDAVLVGPYDLSASLGRLGEVAHPDVQAAIDCVTRVCHDAGVRLGIFGVSAAALQPYLARGYTLLVAGVDTLLLGQAAQAILTELKASGQSANLAAALGVVGGGSVWSGGDDSRAFTHVILHPSARNLAIMEA